jgi:solute carrier family 25 (mitochondrial adenine nucleotide translocator), member 4/5/6/31
MIGKAFSLGHLIDAPIERVKLLLQTQDANPRIASGEIPRYTGIVNCFERVSKEQGTAAFWRGNLANIVRYFPTQVNLAFKDFLQDIFPQYNMQTHFFRWFGVNMASRGLASAVSLLIDYPLDFARTRIGADVGKGADREFNGLVDCITKTAKKGGFFSLYQGFGIYIAGMIVYRGAYFVFYDSAFRVFKPSNVVFKFVIAQAVVASSGFASYPFDTVRRRLMMQSGIEEKLYSGALDCFAKIIKNEGINALFKGAGVDLLRGIFGPLVLVSHNLWKTNFDRTALDHAKNDEVKAALREHGAKHSLFDAAEEGTLELVADLIKEGADVNEKNHDGDTSLHIASSSGHVAVVQTLLEHGADVAARTEYGYTPLDCAQNEEVKAALREHGAKHSLFKAAAEGMLELVADLINEGADVNEKNDVSLHRVLSAPVYKNVKSGQSAHALAWKVHSMGGRPCDHLHAVSVLVHVQSVECPAREGIAACPGRSCRCGTAADRTPALQVGVTSLHHSCSRGHLTVVQTLLENGADVAARSEVRDVGAVGFTSLHVASEFGHLAVVQTLLEHGADVAARTEVGAEGGRAFRCDHATVCCGMLVLARESIAACRGLSCCCGTAADRTPALQRGYISLHWACSRGHPAVVQTLLEHGADVAARDDVGAAGGRACRWCRRGGVRQCLRTQRVRLCGEVACLAGITACRAPCVHDFPVL